MAVFAAAAALVEATVRAQASRQIAAAVASALLRTAIECSRGQPEFEDKKVSKDLNKKGVIKKKFDAEEVPTAQEDKVDSKEEQKLLKDLDNNCAILKKELEALARTREDEPVAIEEDANGDHGEQAARVGRDAVKSAAFKDYTFKLCIY